VRALRAAYGGAQVREGHADVLDGDAVAAGKRHHLEVPHLARGRVGRSFLHELTKLVHVEE
jgi:hypothetical protein